MEKFFLRLGPIFCCLILTDIMIIMTIVQSTVTRKIYSLFLFLCGTIFYYVTPYSLYKYSIEFSYSVRIYLMSHKFFVFYLGAQAFWNYRYLIYVYNFDLKSFTIAVVVISIIDFLRSYVYMNLEENLYSEMYKSYNVKLLMFDFIVKGHTTTYKKLTSSFTEKERFFFQLKKFKKERPVPFDYLTLWEEWTDENKKVTQEEINKIQNSIRNSNPIRNKRASIVLNDNYNTEEIVKPLEGIEKIDQKEYITLYTLKNWNSEHARFIHAFLTNSPNAPIDIERFQEDIKQVNNERFGFYKNLHSQERLKRMVHLILVIIECCIIIFCFGTMMQISISYITIAAPMFLLCVLPSIMERLATFFTILFTHPFDCGDRIYMNGKNLIVNHIYLFSVDVNSWNGTNVIIPNSRLAKEAVGNARRSKSQKGYINILMKNETTKLKSLMTRIEESAKGNEFIKDIIFKIEGVHDCCNINFQIIFTHIRNFQNGFFMWRRHNSFFRDVKLIMDEMGIIYVPNTLNWKVLSDSNNLDEAFEFKEV